MDAVANDLFDRYYLEKIWALIPAVYRDEDGLADNPDVLRAIITVFAEQAAILRRSQDRLWEDQFIDLCNDWAVPYIGDLLGTRLLSAMNRRGMRIDVAKTIYYRRRKGTPRILEELISDISGWDGKLVEAFQRLGRSRHGLDPAPGSLAGHFTGTLPGGWADLRFAGAAELADGPFEEYFHTPDMRKPRGMEGRFGITKLDFYLYRLVSYPVTESDPFSLGDGIRYMFDPSGRDIPLFAKRNRPTGDQWDQWHSAFEWELPVPIRCRLLGDAEYQITDLVVSEMIIDGITVAQADQLDSLIGWKFKNEAQLLSYTSFLSAAFFDSLLNYALIINCGKYQLLPASISVETGNPFVFVPVQDCTAANLSTWSGTAPGKRLAIDPVRGRFLFLNGALGTTPVTVSYHYGFSGPFGAGSYYRSAVTESTPTRLVVPGTGNTIGPGDMLSTGITQVNSSKTFTITASNLNIADFTLQADNEERPYLLLSADLILDTGANIDATLILDGLWLGSPGGNNWKVILQGHYKCVIIRNCSFDPGGDTNALGQPINPVFLQINGDVKQLCIDHSIMSPLMIVNNGLIEDTIFISDSIIQSIDPSQPAIDINTGKMNLCRSTVFGKMNVHTLYASDSLITDLVTVIDNQTGCFRFSAAPATSRLPRPYESYLFTSDSNSWFTSRKFGQPGYAQLMDVAPANLYRKADNGAEMGVFNSLLNAIKLDGLQTKIEEYMPFGLIPAYINET